MEPTGDQIKRFFKFLHHGFIDAINLDAFLCRPDHLVQGQLIDCEARRTSLLMLVRRVVGRKTTSEINKTYPLKQKFQTYANGPMRLEVFQDNSLAENLRRLKSLGYEFPNVRHLAFFLLQHPKECKKFFRVYAFSVDSLWIRSPGDVRVPYFEQRYFDGKFVKFDHEDIDERTLANAAVLVYAAGYDFDHSLLP